MYSVKEIFYTLQGEGAHSGRPAIFLRFSGCNLWSGREKDRSQAICDFCDTDFVGTDGPMGGQFHKAEDLAKICKSLVPNFKEDMLIVLTGGEPSLQIDTALITALKNEGFFIAVETNGSLAAHPDLDWICVSPKAGADFVQKSGNELKIIVPQRGLTPEAYSGLKFDHFFVQPMEVRHNNKIDEIKTADNMKWAIEYCKQHPQWKLSLQTHKILNIP